jgi:hypothetical protein
MKRPIATVVLLGLASFAQDAPQQATAAPKKAVDSQQASKKKTLSVMWEVHVPFVHCDNGKPVLTSNYPM